MYRAARVMGNLQPWGDFLATGDGAELLRSVTRRQVRRAVGKAFSRMQFGGGGWASVLGEVGLMLLGRLIGVRGRR